MNNRDYIMKDGEVESQYYFHDLHYFRKCTFNQSKYNGIIFGQQKMS